MIAFTRFSWSRIAAVMVKEFIQMRRDRLTFAMIIGVPIVQLVLFGYAINTDPKRMPAAVIVADHGPVSRAILTGMQLSNHFEIEEGAPTEAEARTMLERGDVAFIVTIPADFERKLVRGERPQILVEADATDPAASAGGIAALPTIIREAVNDATAGALYKQRPGNTPVDLVVHRLYNPEGVTALNIVPGLLGVILTLTTILMTALAITREVERGTIENLMAMPARPVEIMLRLCADRRDPDGGEGSIRGADARLACPAPLHHAALHRLERHARLHVLHRRAVTDAGDADDGVLLPAVDPAVGLHVPLSRHAGMGARHRRGDPAHAFPARRPRRDAEGERLRRDMAECLAVGAVLAGGRDRRPSALPAHPRLKPSPARDW
jgi:hypothetical protein